MPLIILTMGQVPSLVLSAVASWGHVMWDKLQWLVLTMSGEGIFRRSKGWIRNISSQRFSWFGLGVDKLRWTHPTLFCSCMGCAPACNLGSFFLNLLFLFPPYWPRAHPLRPPITGQGSFPWLVSLYEPLPLQSQRTPCFPQLPSFAILLIVFFLIWFPY